jgi:ribulose-phosphate 3-epimerase
MNFWTQMPNSRLLVEVSLWSADFTHLEDEIRRVDSYADLYHIDVSDGHFVPGLLFFADLVAALRPLTEKPFHVHLMTTDPRSHITDFISAGANMITLHAENGPIAPGALEAVRKAGAASGLALGLGVLPEAIEPYLDLVDMLLIMGTPMGVKGVSLSPHVFNRLKKIKEMVARAGLEKQIKVFADGGIRENTVPKLYSAGADGVIAGSLAFKSPNLEETFSWLHGLQR